MNRIKKISGEYPWLGPLLWIASIQFFIIQAIVGLGWRPPYSIKSNTISDLGNSACGQYSGRFICSSSHSLMNASFVILGLTMIFGAAFIYNSYKKSRGSLLGFSLLGLSGLGTVLVGLFPENTISIMHIIGAGLSFALGGLALLALGYSLELPKPLRMYTLISGVVALAALVLFISHVYLGIGIGGMERLGGHPVTIWLITFGAYLSQKQNIR